LREVEVRGTISFQSDAEPFDKATAYIRMRDVSMQDSAAKILAEQVIGNLKYVPSMRIEFFIKGKIEDERGTYDIYVLIDVNGDGKQSVGDYITTGSYLISSTANTTGLNIPVQRIVS
jgi:hypothetical protein